MQHKKDKLKLAIFILLIAALIVFEIITQNAKVSEIVETVSEGTTKAQELKTESTTEAYLIPSFTYTEEMNTTTAAASTTRPEVKTTKAVVLVSPTGKKTKLDGKFKITCYTPYSDGGRWGYATSTGVRSQHLATCAVDPNVIPLGSTIEVNGLTLFCCDIGGAVKGNHIDVFYDGTDSEACAWLAGFGESQEVEIYV